MSRVKIPILVITVSTLVFIALVSSLILQARNDVPSPTACVWPIGTLENLPDETSTSSEKLYEIPSSQTSIRSRDVKPEIVQAILVAMREHGMDTSLYPWIESIVVAESSGNPLAKNQRSGATGLMQITAPAVIWYFDRPDAHGRILDKPIDLTDVATNLEIGVSHVQKLQTLVSNWGVPAEDYWPTILACYNWGQGNVARKALDQTSKSLVRSRLPKETQDYISKITERVRASRPL